MIVDIQTRRLRTIGQLRAFVEGNEAVDFQPRHRDETYGFVPETLERFGYRRLGKRDKGAVLKFLAAATGVSRQQMECLVRQWRETGAVRDRRGGGRVLAVRAQVRGGGHPAAGGGRRSLRTDVRAGPPAKSCGASSRCTERFTVRAIPPSLSHWTAGCHGPGPHFSPGAVMIAEDFGPVVHNGHVRVLATESIAGPTVEGACARTGPCVHGATRPARARPAQSATGTIVGIAVNFLKP